MNWYKKSNQEENYQFGQYHPEGDGCYGYIAKRLIEKGITHKSYDEINTGPLRPSGGIISRDDVENFNDPNWEYLGQGAQARVFKYIPTGEVFKFPRSNGRGQAWSGGTTTETTSMDKLIRIVHEAANLNAAQKIL